MRLLSLGKPLLSDSLGQAVTGDSTNRHMISSITSGVGLIGPFRALSMASKTFAIPENMDLLKVAMNAVLPVQCRW